MLSKGGKAVPESKAQLEEQSPVHPWHPPRHISAPTADLFQIWAGDLFFWVLMWSSCFEKFGQGSWSLQKCNNQICRTSWTCWTRTSTSRSSSRTCSGSASRPSSCSRRGRRSCLTRTATTGGTWQNSASSLGDFPDTPCKRWSLLLIHFIHAVTYFQSYAEWAQGCVSPRGLCWW